MYLFNRVDIIIDIYTQILLQRFNTSRNLPSSFGKMLNFAYNKSRSSNPSSFFEGFSDVGLLSPPDGGNPPDGGDPFDSGSHSSDDEDFLYGDF